MYTLIDSDGKVVLIGYIDRRVDGYYINGEIWPLSLILIESEAPGLNYKWNGTSFVEVIVEPPFDEEAFKAEAKIYLDSVRVLREKVLARINGYAVTLMLKEPPEQLEEKQLCSEIIQCLLDITILPDVLAATSVAQIKAAVKAEYARLVSISSVELVKAFRSVDV